MFLSIIIPVYNNASFVGECLDSCLKQDIDKNDYEIICIDDCSTDESLEIAKRYEKEYPNVKVLGLEKNSGPSAARNAGLDIEKGDYVFFVDSDDFIMENCLGEIKNALDGIDMMTVGMYVFHDDRANLDQGRYAGVPTAGYIGGKIISKNAIGDVRFLENVAYGEDEIFLFEIGHKGINNGEFDKPVYYYRKHAGAAMTITPEKRLKRIDSVLNAATYLIDNYAPYSQKTVKLIDDRIVIAFTEIAEMGRAQRKCALKNVKDRGLFQRKLEKSVVGRRRSYIKRRLAVFKHMIVGLFKKR